MDAQAIQQLVERHPESVAQLFSAYGYDMPVTEKHIRLMLKVNGNKPLPISNADGEQSKKTFADYLNELIIPGLQIAGTLFGSKTPQTTAVAPKAATTPEPKPTPRIAGINRNLFILLFVVVVIIIVLLIKKHAK